MFFLVALHIKGIRRSSGKRKVHPNEINANLRMCPGYTAMINKYFPGRVDSVLDRYKMLPSIRINKKVRYKKKGVL